MSLSVGLPNAAGITIGGKSAKTIRELSDATADAAAQALGAKEGTISQSRPVLLVWTKAPTLKNRKPATTPVSL